MVGYASIYELSRTVGFGGLIVLLVGCIMIHAIRLVQCIKYTITISSDAVAGHQGSSQTDHRTTTSFGPFKLPTCGCL